MIDLLAAKRKCLPMAGVLRFGGGSSSENTTKNIDTQVGASENGQAVGVSGDGNNITFTDQGAVKGALDMALKGVEGAYNFAQQAQASQGSLVTGALQNAADQQAKFASTIENIKTSDVRVLIISGLAVVGIAAVMLAKKG